MRFSNVDISKYCRFLGLLLVMLVIFFVLSSSEEEMRSDNHAVQLYSNEYKEIELENFSLLNSLNILTLAEGKQEMAKHKIVIVGITRDNIKDIPIMIKHIEYIGSLFADYRVILFENDSIDGTKMILNEWKSVNSKVNIISKDYGNKKRPGHAFMAEARNNYLEALEAQEYDGFDLVMMLDMDFSYGIDIRAIADSFSKIDQWDAVCSNGVKSEGRMFDSFAFRSEEFPWAPEKWQEICSQNDLNNEWSAVCREGEAHSRGVIVDNLVFRMGWQERNRLYWLLIKPQIQKIFSINDDLVPVLSCFGGMAFYKRDFIKDCRYKSVRNDCEHVTFHQCLREKHEGKIFLNPAQVMRYPQYGN